MAPAERIDLMVEAGVALMEDVLEGMQFADLEELLAYPKTDWAKEAEGRGC
jgi:hypothetical protein